MALRYHASMSLKHVTLVLVRYIIVSRKASIHIPGPYKQRIRPHSLGMYLNALIQLEKNVH